MHISIVVGSSRMDSESSRVGQYISARINDLNPCSEVSTVSLEGNPLPLWDDGFPVQDERWRKVWQPIDLCLKSSDGLIFIVPEWNGMIPPGLKNFFHLLSSEQVGHKPALLVGVSSGSGGAYAVAEAKMFSSKNNHIVYIPEQVVIRRVAEVLRPSDASKPNRTLARIDYSLAVLFLYCEALKSVRLSGTIDVTRFGFGM